MPAWYAIYCRSKFERTVENGLTEAGIEAYYPSYFESRKWSDRSKQVERPLFRGYIFARFRRSAETSALVLQTHGVASILGTPVDGPIRIPDADIAAVKALLASGLPLHHMDITPEFRIDEAVDIKYGPFAGNSGRIVRVKNKLRLVVTITALNCSKYVEVDREMLVSSEPPKPSKVV